MDAMTTVRLARLDDLQAQRGAIHREINALRTEVSCKRAAIDALSLASDALAERFNAERTALAGSSAGTEPAGDADGTDATPPPMMFWEPRACMKLFVPGRKPLHVGVPPGHEERAKTLLLSFMMLFPARA